MKYFTLLFLMFVLSACVPPAVGEPVLATSQDAIQRFVPFCQEGFLVSGTIHYREIANIASDACQTYTIVPLSPSDRITSRISGRNLEINRECVIIDSVVTPEDEFERIRCLFTNSLAVVNLYLLGEDIIVISEVQSDSRMFYLPPLGVESEYIP